MDPKNFGCVIPVKIDRSSVVPIKIQSITGKSLEYVIFKNEEVYEVHLNRYSNRPIVIFTDLDAILKIIDIMENSIHVS